MQKGSLLHDADSLDFERSKLFKTIDYDKFKPNSVCMPYVA